ncbi:GTP cyclohydrolase II [Crenothrix sp. D3]|nr:GTP cyclohydrolase II [Crenothrix sp. D3]
MKQQLEDLVQTPLPTEHGDFILHYYSNTLDDKEHLALVKGEVAGKENVPVRIHSECFTGDVLGSRRCDCGEQLAMAMQYINGAGFGVVIYLRQEGRGIGLLKKLQAYNLQDQGMDTVDANIYLGYLADEREYDVAALILQSLGIKSIKLMTNNPKKIEALTKLGIEVIDRIPIEVVANNDNVGYLKTKAKRMAHFLFNSNTKP